MLLPFNQVDSMSAQLLLAHPLDKKARKGEEVIVASEALHMGNGLDHYVVVTTMRVVLFRLKVVDGQGFITVNLVWQLSFGKGTRISSSLGHRGHNGSILYICQKREDLDEAGDFNHSLRNTIPEVTPSIKNDQDRQSDYFCVEGEGKYSSPETPKSFNPLGPTTAAFRLRTAWPFAATDGDGVTRYAIEGEFKQGSQLSRIHNAICCLSGNFDSIIYERNPNDSCEGTTSFGPLIFERPQQRPEILVENDKDALSSLYSSLERTMWKCDGLQQDTPLFSEVLRNSGLSGGPSWLVESRARGMFVPPPPPILLSNVDPARDKVVSQVLSELEHGLRTSESASQDIYSHAHSLNFQKVKQGLAENEYFRRRSPFGFDNNESGMEEDYSISSSFPKSVDSTEFNNHFDNPSAYEQDSFLNEGLSVEGYGRLGASPLVEDSNHTRIPPKPSPTARKDPSTNSFFIDETPLQEKLPKIDESLPANLSQTHTRPVSTPLLSAVSTPKETGYERYGLDERLRRVEAMLDCLVGSDSSTATMSHVGRLNPPTQIVQHDNDYLSVASSFNPLTTSTPTHRSHEGHVEVEALRKEIEDLKIQLAAKNDSSASTNLSLVVPSMERYLTA